MEVVMMVVVVVVMVMFMVMLMLMMRGKVEHVEAIWMEVVGLVLTDENNFGGS